MTASAPRAHSIAIPADYFLAFVDAAIAARRPHLEIYDVEVAGEVDLSGREFLYGLRLERISFRDAVLIRNCSFAREFCLHECDFDTLLDLSNAQLKGGLQVSDCRIGLDNVNLGRQKLVLDGADVTGEIFFRETFIHGLFLARRLVVKGEASFRGCTIIGDSAEHGAVVDLSNGDISGTVNFSRIGIVEPSFPFEAVNRETNAPRRARRSVYIDRSRRISISLRNTKTTSVSLGVGKFVGGLDCHYLQCRAFRSPMLPFGPRPEDERWSSNICFGGAEVDGDIMLSGGDIGMIRMFGIHVSGSIMLIDGRSGQIEIEDGVYDGDYIVMVGSHIGSFFMSSWRCHDYVRLHPSKIWGNRDERGLIGIGIASSEIERGLSLWPGYIIGNTLQGQFNATAGRYDREVHVFERGRDGRGSWTTDRRHLNRWKRGMEVRGKVNLKHCQIGEDLILTGLSVVDEDVRGAGCIEVLHSEIKGNVKFESPASYISESEHESTVWQTLARFLVVRGALGIPDTNRIEGVTDDFSVACCDRVDFSDMTAECVDLSGLRIRVTGPVDAQFGGGVDLHSAEIKQKLATFARLSAAQVLLAFLGIRDVLATAALPAPQSGGAPVGHIHSGPFPAELLASRPEHEDHRWNVLLDCFGSEVLEAVNARAEIPNNCFETGADIPGALNLQHAIVDELVISDVSFCDHLTSCDAAHNGIVLSHAKINRLYVARRGMVGDGSGEHNGFPVPLNLLDVDVRGWFLESPEDPARDEAFLDGEAITTDSYLDLLDNDPDFRMSSYLAIEQSLRNRGLESEATRIYIAGVYRDTRDQAQMDKSAQLRRSEAASSREGSSLLVWRRGDGRFRRKTWWYPGFRLVRPRREYISLVLCLFGIVAGTLVFHNLPWQFQWKVLGFVAYMIFGFIAFRQHVRVFVDHLFWSVLDYGTSAARLALVIGVLMLVSFVFVTDRENFEPSLASTADWNQRALLDQAKLAHSELINSKTAPQGTAMPEALQAQTMDRPANRDWPLGERLWMTFRYHVPLVDAVVAEEWQPSTRPASIHFVSPVKGGRPAKWPFAAWARARDWFGAMLWVNWILWPLFLPFLIRTLTRSK